jgi:integrase
MLTDYPFAEQTLERLRGGAAGVYLDDFTAWLADGGYAQTTIRSYIYAADRCLNWAQATGQVVSALDADSLTRYKAHLAVTAPAGLLAVTGLRISEALALRLDDITDDGLVIRKTKFHKSRLVPLHASSTVALGRYLQRRQCVVSDDDHLFVSLRRTRLCYATVRRLFQRLCSTAGLPHQPYGRRLRLHDLRHSAAVRMLAACPHERERVTSHMLALSTYLGHGSLRGTFWYLHSTPDLMRDIASAGEAWMTGGAP